MIISKTKSGPRSSATKPGALSNQVCSVCAAVWARWISSSRSRSAATRGVSSVQAQKRPPMRPCSSYTGLYDQVNHVGSV